MKGTQLLLRLELLDMSQAKSEKLHNSITSNSISTAFTISVFAVSNKANTTNGLMGNTYKSTK